ncbi:MAG: tetratricopeptide repeat protein [Desulfovibrionaceae bacterium]
MSLEKITLYKEMLLIEPASKIFFPLAKLLSVNSNEDDAIDVLRKGIVLNPEHFEARLLLIELLYSKGYHTEQEEHIEKIIAIFSSYSTFLRAWNEKISAVNGDMSVALSLLSSALNNENISLNTVIQYGFQALKGMKKPNTSKKKWDNREDTFLEIQKEEDNTQEELCEPTVRTRSMANLLLEQGAFEEALIIYKELYEKSINKKQGEELLEIISSIENTLLLSGTNSMVTELEDVDEKPPMAVDTKHKIITTLAALVERLDARADALSPK